MTAYGQPVNEGLNGVLTTSEFGDLGDGNSGWYENMKAADGGIVALGAKADAAVTNPATPASLIAYIKGLLTRGATSNQGLYVAPVPVTSAPVSAANSTSQAAEASRIIKASAGQLFGISIFNAKASAQYVLLIDAASVPSDGAVTLGAVPLYIPATTNFSVDFGVTGRRFQNGIVVCNSSTIPAKAIGSADCYFDAQYA